MDSNGFCIGAALLCPKEKPATAGASAAKARNVVEGIVCVLQCDGAR